MTLANAGTIVATGANALVIDTGDKVVTNTGMLAATGVGGLVIESALANAGQLWANGGDVTVNGDVTGGGDATLTGAATLTFGAAADADVTFGDGDGTLVLDQAAAFTGTVVGFGAGDTLALGDVGAGSGTPITWQANDAGTGGTLTVSDGTTTASIEVVGQYAAAGAQADADGTGTVLSYDAPAADHVMLGGAADDVLTAGGGNDTLAGGLGNDSLTGGLGNDSLTGGAGEDVFRFDSVLNGATNVDAIGDFSHADDTIGLNAALFGGVAGGTLAAEAFLAADGATAAVTAEQHVIYDTATGDLYYDADGAGGAEAVKFATLTDKPADLSHDDFNFT
jgi:Ca2+-binding RTX toxin-like protein